MAAAMAWANLSVFCFEFGLCRRAHIQSWMATCLIFPVTLACCSAVWHFLLAVTFARSSAVWHLLDEVLRIAASSLKSIEFSKWMTSGCWLRCHVFVYVPSGTPSDEKWMRKRMLAEMPHAE